MTETRTPDANILLVESDILVRHLLADYLRTCGLTVFETSNGDEAIAVLVAGTSIDVVIADVGSAGGFVLRQRIRAHDPTIEVVLAGTVEKAVAGAARVCEEGPALAKPYEHHVVLDQIRRSLARRERRGD